MKGLTTDFKAGRIKPGRKSVQNPPDRLLYREKHLKQSCQLEKEKRACRFVVMLPFVLDNAGKIIIQRKFCDNSASNKYILL